MKMKKLKKNIKIVLIISMLLFGFVQVIAMSKFVDFKFEYPKPVDRSSISVLSANVGNLNLTCKKYLYKLCSKDVEDRITKNIRLLNPDLIVLQEVLAPWQYKAERNKRMVYYYPSGIPQVRRLVGDGYSIICNSRNQFECVALKTSVGQFEGCLIGELCNTARTAWPIQACDNGFTISAATIILSSGFKFDLINMHPQSTSKDCRSKMLETAFRSTEIGGIINEKNLMIVGDFNFDPWRQNDTSTKVWNSFFNKGWADYKFNYHIDIKSNGQPFYTTYLFGQGKTVDFGVSNFATGELLVLGESPKTIRLDQGRGTDHRALFGYLKIKP